MGLELSNINEDGTWLLLLTVPSMSSLLTVSRFKTQRLGATSDGQEQVITVTIIGTDDAAVANDDSGSVTEDINVDEVTNQLVTSGQVVVTDI